MTQHRGQPSDQPGPVVDRSEGHSGSGALGDVQHRDGDAGLAAERTTSVARAGVARPDPAQVHAPAAGDQGGR